MGIMAYGTGILPILAVQIIFAKALLLVTAKAEILALLLQRDLSVRCDRVVALLALKAQKGRMPVWPEKALPVGGMSGMASGAVHLLRCEGDRDPVDRALGSMAVLTYLNRLCEQEILFLRCMRLMTGRALTIVEWAMLTGLSEVGLQTLVAFPAEALLFLDQELLLPAAMSLMTSCA